MTTGPAPVCFKCKHFRPEEAFFDKEALEEYSYCAAFPDGKGIPFEILVGGNSHEDPFPGDHGIQFEKKQGKNELP